MWVSLLIFAAVMAGSVWRDGGIVMKIKDLCPQERPREKMIERGASAMSNAELMAIILRTGTGKRNVLEIANMILNKAEGSLTKASVMSIEEFCNIEGIGPDKAVTLCAALELGKRMCSETPDNTRNIIHSSSDVVKVLAPVLRGLQHEECWLLFLARNNKVLSKERLSVGGQSETIVEVKSVVRRAIDIRASSVIIAHNHPSGDPHPGNADVKMTQNLKKALEIFDISLLDHVIFADGRYYSFSDEMEYSL